MNTLDTPINPPSAEYIGVAETAKLIRAALKKTFPGQKFSVVSESYSGGACININYTGGPATSAVKAITNAYTGGGFDGSIDMAYCRHSWLAPDGSASPAYSSGTENSRGSHTSEIGDPHAAGCRYVRFGSDHVFVNRTATDADYWACVFLFEKLIGKVVRHNTHENWRSIKTDRKNSRGHWVYNWVAEGREVTKVCSFASKSEEPLPDIEDGEALSRYMNTGITYGMLCSHYSWQIFEQNNAPEITDAERKERAKYIPNS